MISWILLSWWSCGESNSSPKPSYS